MRPALVTLTHHLFDLAWSKAAPIIATGLIAMAHELCPEKAKAEMPRRDWR